MSRSYRDATGDAPEHADTSRCASIVLVNRTPMRAPTVSEPEKTAALFVISAWIYEAREITHL